MRKKSLYCPQDLISINKAYHRVTDRNKGEKKMCTIVLVERVLFFKILNEFDDTCLFMESDLISLIY